MTNRWLCIKGHSGTGPTGRPSCPVCGAALASLVTAGAAAPEESYDTLMPDAPSCAPDPAPTFQQDAPTRVPEPGPTLLPAGLTAPLMPEAPPADEADRTALPTAPAAKTEMPNGRPTYPAGAGEAPTLLPAVLGAAQPAGGSQIMPGYEILGVLGRGGMGVVYKARQSGLNRVVALKMIISGPHASDEELGRFKIEAEAVASLQHPNIVQIHDMGVRDGRPYFSLEFCEGGSLQSRLDGTPMSPTAAARLMRTLADAIAHAHSHGIIHRDLKPANILLVEGKDHPLERCTPKITDFGLAKRMNEDQGQTATEAILGTPTYMAPEQAQGKTRQAGPAADVYALGAILYDLLTGRPPFKGASALDTIQMVQTAEPVPPTRLQPGVPGDLQTITLKCLEKDPKKRYATAVELAADLSRFLEGKPIHARPVSAAERAWKFTRRNPLLVTVLALGFLAPTALLAMSVAYSKELTKERDNAIDARNQANTARLKADEETQKATESAIVAKMAREVAVAAEVKAQESFLEVQQAVEQLVKLSEARLRFMAGTDAVRLALLRDALRLSQKLTVLQSDSPAAKVRVAHGYRLVGSIREKLGGYEEALTHFEKSIALMDAVLTPGSEAAGRSDWQNDAVEVVLLRWKVLEATKKVEADGVLDGALARLDALPEAVRANWVTRRTRAAVLTNRAIHHENRSAPAKAAKDLDDAATLLEALVKDADVEPLPNRLAEIKQELARVLANRAALKLSSGARSKPDGVTFVDIARAALHVAPASRGAYANASLERAAADADKAIEHLEAVTSERPRDPETLKELGRAVATKGLVLSALGRYPEAATLAGQAVARFRTASKDSPENVDLRHLLGLALSDRGLYLVQARDYKAAGTALDEARALLTKLADEVPAATVFRKDLARADTSSGLLSMARKQHAEALVRLTEARAGFDRTGDGESARQVWTNLVSCRDTLAHERAKAGDRRAAAGHLAALADLRRSRLADLPKTATGWAIAERVLAGADLLFTLQARARVLADDGDYPTLSEVITEMEALAGRSWPAHVEQLPALARALVADPGRAKQYRDQALRLLKGQKRTQELEAFLTGADLAPLRAEPGYRQVLESLPRR